MRSGNEPCPNKEEEKLVYVLSQFYRWVIALCSWIGSWIIKFLDHLGNERKKIIIKPGCVDLIKH